MNFIKKTNHLNKLKSWLAKNPIIALLLLLLLSSVIFVATGSLFMCLIISLSLMFIICQRILSPNLFKSKVFIGAVALFCYSSLIQLVLYSCWLVYDQITIPVGLIILQLFLSATFWLVKDFKVKETPAVTLSDLVSILAAVVFVAALVFFPIHRAGLGLSTGFIELINTGTDNTSHLRLFNDRYDFKEIITKTQADKEIARINQISYPAGWHMANAAIAITLAPSMEVGYDSAFWFTFNKIFWTGFLTYILGASSGAMIIGLEKRKFLVGIWLFMSTLLFAFWFVADHAISGFYNFIPILISVPIFVLSLIQLSKTKRFNDFALSICLPIILIGGVTLSWLLVAPVFGVALLIICWPRLSKVKKFFRDLIKLKNRQAVILAVVTLIISLGGVFTQFKLSQEISTPDSFVGIITASGGIKIYSLGFYLFLAAGCLPILNSVYRSSSKKGGSVYQSILIFLACAASFAFFIYLIQQYYGAGMRYYFFKTLNITTMCAIMMLIIGGGILLVKSKASFLSLLSMMGLAMLFGVIILFPDPSFIHYATKTHSTPRGVSKFVANELKSNFTKANYYNKDVIIFLSPADKKYYLETASMLMKSNKPQSECYDRASYLSVVVNSKNVLAKHLKKLPCDDYKLKIFVSESEVGRLNNMVKKNKLTNIRFLPVPEN